MKEVLVDDRPNLGWQIEEAVAWSWVRSQRHRHLMVDVGLQKIFGSTSTSRTEDVGMLCRDRESLLDGGWGDERIWRVLLME